MNCLILVNLKRYFIFIIFFVIGFISTNEIKSSNKYTNESGYVTSLKNSKEQTISTDYLKTKFENNYILGPGDGLTIIVARDYPELITQVIINGEGMIYLPKLENVFVKDLTVSELKNLLDKAYKEYVKYPDVEILVNFYRPIQILIEGEVNSPGYYTLKGSISLEKDPLERLSFQTDESPFDLTQNYESRNKPKIISTYFPNVFDALRLSGGITDYSDLSNIVLIRKNKISDGGGKIQTKLNFQKDISSNLSQNIRIYDGDIIRLKKLNKPDPYQLSQGLKFNLNSRFINVIVAGRVNSEGLKTLPKSSTLKDAIEIAGGTKFFKGKIKYLTYNNGLISKVEIPFRKMRKRGSSSNPYLKNGDLIIVGDSILSNTASLIKEVTEPFQGLYSTIRLIELISD